MIELNNLVKRYDGKTVTSNAVNGIDFEVPEGMLFTLLGPSGCGKTTTLRMIAGLERPTDGEILLDEEAVYSRTQRAYVPANKRPIGMVFQSYAIWPHMSVFDNVSFPLKVGKPKPGKAEIRERTEKALDTVGLADYINRASTALSGGQQQRVALARALVNEPKVLLLDEPLSNLDAKLRERMREEIREVQQRTGITTVYVTHDQGEALAISDLIMVMNEGEIVEVGRPQDIYTRPQSAFAADFIGVSNNLQGLVHRVDGERRAEITTDQGMVACEPNQGFEVGEDVTVFIRPEGFKLSRTRHSENAWQGKVKFTIYQGDCWDYHVEVEGKPLRVRLHNEKVGLSHGDTVYLEPDTEAVVVLGEKESNPAATKGTKEEALGHSSS